MLQCSSFQKLKTVMTEKLIYKKKKVIGNCTLYLGDCESVLSTLDRHDAVVTDPPYGIKQDKGFNNTGRTRFGVKDGKRINRRRYAGGWDNDRPGVEIFEKIIEVSDNQIIFGGNHFADLLPRASHWFVWNKKNTMPSYSDCELIWTSINKKSVKMLDYEYNGVLGRREKRVHPTQKPYEVMRWCIEKLPGSYSTILDPYMGSGTTGVACAKLGLKFTGIEINQDYFDIACDRVHEAYLQPDLFISQNLPDGALIVSEPEEQVLI